MRITAGIAILGLVLLFVWERADLVRLGYQVQRLEKHYKRLSRERDELQVKQSALSSPEYIARVATGKLGMVHPEPGQLVLVTVDLDVFPDQPVAGVKVRMAKNEFMKR